MKKLMKANIALIGINILLFLTMIVSIITNDKDMFSLYGIFVTLMYLYETLYLLKWSKIKSIDIDKEKSKAIRYSFDGITSTTFMITTLVYLIYMAFETFHPEIKDNIFVCVIMYIILTVALLFYYLAVSAAKKDTKRLINKTFNKQK